MCVCVCVDLLLRKRCLLALEVDRELWRCSITTLSTDKMIIRESYGGGCNSSVFAVIMFLTLRLSYNCRDARIRTRY